jgi:integrase
VDVLGLNDLLTVHAARHHSAVLALRAGVPVRVVQCQLGHATPTLTLGLYGAFLPTGEDRANRELDASSPPGDIADRDRVLVLWVDLRA